MPIKIQMDISVDERGVKMTSKGLPQKMNKVEEQVVVALMSVVKLFLEQASQQIAVSLKAAESADKLIKSVEETMEDADGIEGIKRAFLADVAAKEAGGVIRGPDGQLLDPSGGVPDTTGTNVVQFPASNGSGECSGEPPQPHDPASGQDRLPPTA